MLVIGLYLTANGVIAFMIQQCVTAVVFVYELLPPSSAKPEENTHEQMASHRESTFAKNNIQRTSLGLIQKGKIFDRYTRKS